MVNYCFALPILPGGLEHIKKFCQENIDTKEHNEFYQIAGVIREQTWIQRSPQGSGAPDFEIVSMETNDPSHMFKEFSASNHPWVVRFREYAHKMYAIDFTAPPPPLNENVVDWEQQRK
jgi:hypothetical protein